jgi:carbon storage regulator
MLVLGRKVGERILVGDQVRITVVRVTNGGVRLGIEAPEGTTVVREELVLAKDTAAVAALQEGPSHGSPAHSSPAHSSPAHENSAAEPSASGKPTRDHGLRQTGDGPSGD